MRKLYYLILVMILSVSIVSLSYGQDKSPKKGMGGGYFMVGGNMLDLDVLNNSLANAGYSEFSKLDQDTAKKVETATVRARELFDSGINMDESISQANDETRLQYALDEIPKANKGVLNNKDSTASKIKPLKKFGLMAQQIKKVLTDRGWSQAEASDILKRANFDAGTSFLKTATNPKTGEKVGWDGKQWTPIK